MSFAAAVVPAFPGLSTASSAVSLVLPLPRRHLPPSRSVGSSHLRTTTSTTAPFSRGTLLKPVLFLFPRIGRVVGFPPGNSSRSWFCDDREISNLKKKTGGIIKLFPGLGALSLTNRPVRSKGVRFRALTHMCEVQRPVP